jgi:hypothetical protein
MVGTKTMSRAAILEKRKKNLESAREIRTRTANLRARLTPETREHLAATRVAMQGVTPHLPLSSPPSPSPPLRCGPLPSIAGIAGRLRRAPGLLQRVREMREGELEFRE